MKPIRRVLLALAAALTLAVPVAAIAAPAPVSAHHSGSCNISSPMIQQQWGCGKHGRTSSTFGYVQLDDTHTNGKGVYAYSVRAGQSGQPWKWDWAASRGGDKKTFWFSAPWSIEWIAYCNGSKWSNGANCILKGW